jgi:hypothetical protein
MEEENKINNLCIIALSTAYFIFTFQYAKHKGSTPIIDWLPESIQGLVSFIGIFGGISAMSFFLMSIIMRLGGGLLASLVGVFGFHAAWFWFLFSINK